MRAARFVLTVLISAALLLQPLPAVAKVTFYGDPNAPAPSVPGPPDLPTPVESTNTTPVPEGTVDPAPADTPTTPAAEGSFALAELQGTYQIGYQDTRLGIVAGMVQVVVLGDTVSVKGFYLDPASDRRYEMRGRIERHWVAGAAEPGVDAGQRLVSFRLETTGPISPAVARANSDGAVTIGVPMDGALTAELGGKKASVSLTPPQPLFVTFLASLDGGTLKGIWMHPVDPATGRGPGGAGRGGEIDETEAGATARGGEVWQRQVPQFVGEARPSYSDMRGLEIPVTLQGTYLPAHASQITSVTTTAPGAQFSWYEAMSTDGTAATLKLLMPAPINPGRYDLTINGGKGYFDLQYKDVGRALRIVRQLREDQYETAATVFPGETVYVEMALTDRGAARTVALGAEPLLVATRSPGPEPTPPPDDTASNGTDPAAPLPQQFELTALRIGQTEIFRSPAILCAPNAAATTKEGETAIACPAGGTLVAQLATAGDQMVVTAARLGTEPSNAWAEAMAKAEACRLAGAPRQTRGITFGDETHAALILMRDRLLREVDKQMETMNALSDLGGQRRFRDALIAKYSNSGEDPLFELEVPTPDGAGEIHLSRAFYQFDRTKEPERWDSYTITSVAQAQGKLMSAMTRTLGKLRGMQDCDVEQQLGMLGMGYDAVNGMLQPEMMQRGPDGRIVPDLGARAALDSIRTLSEAVAADQAYSDLKRDMALMIAAGGVAALAYGAGVAGYAAVEAVATLAASVGLDAVGAAIGARAVMDALTVSRAEKEVALGAAPVAGLEPYRLADARQTERLLQGAMEAVGFVLGPTIVETGARIVADLPGATTLGRVGQAIAQQADRVDDFFARQTRDRIIERAKRDGLNSLSSWQRQQFDRTVTSAMEKVRAHGFASLTDREAAALNAQLNNARVQAASGRLGNPRDVEVLQLVESAGAARLNRLREANASIGAVEADGLTALDGMRPERARTIVDAINDARARRATLGDARLDPAERRLLAAADRLSGDAAARAQPVRLPPIGERMPGELSRGRPLDPANGLQDLQHARDAVNVELDRARLRADLLSTADEATRREAKNRVKDLEFRRRVIDDSIKDGAQNPANLSRMTGEDLDWLSGRRAELTPEDTEAARRTLFDKHHGNWRKAIKDPELSKAELHRLNYYRKREIDQMLDEVLRGVEADTGGRLTADAFGSNSLTSDYDLSARAVAGSGAERVVHRFNERFREVFGKDSALVFDTNIYTDAAYKRVAPDDTRALGFDLAPSQADAVRQFEYAQAKARRYMTDDQWQRQVDALKAAAPEDQRAAVDRILSDVDRNVRLMDGKVNARVEELARTRNLDLADEEVREILETEARNDIYGEVLRSIDLYDSELRRLKALDLRSDPGAGAAPELAKPGSAYAAALAEMRRLADAGNWRGVEALRKEWMARLSNQVRNQQGYALVFAAEAYHTSGAIRHVVDDLQATRGGKVTLEKLRGKPVGTDLSNDDYHSSFIENRGDLYKELNHMRDANGAFPEPVKAAEKAAKYFPRQLDAAHQMGVDLGKLPDPAVVDLAVKLDQVRGNAAEVARVLQQAGVSGEQFVRQVEVASEFLSTETWRAAGLPETLPDIARYMDEADALVRSIGDPELAADLARLGDWPPDGMGQLAWARARAEAETVLGVNGLAGNPNAADRARFEALIRSGAAQRQLSDAAAAARTAGLTQQEIEAAMGDAGMFVLAPAEARRGAARRIERLTLERTGALIVDAEYADGLRAMAQRLRDGKPRDIDIARIQGGQVRTALADRSYFEELAATGTFTDADGFRRALSDDDINEIFNFAVEKQLIATANGADVLRHMTLEGYKKTTPLFSAGTPLQLYNDSCGLMVADGILRDRRPGGASGLTELETRTFAADLGLFKSGEGMTSQQLADWLLLNGAKNVTFTGQPVSTADIESALLSGYEVAAMIRTGSGANSGAHWIRIENVEVVDGVRMFTIGDPSTGQSWHQSFDSFSARYMPGNTVISSWGP